MNSLIRLIEASSFSHPKRIDKINEDAILPAFEVGGAIFLALADGVGGYYGGDIASHAAISTIREKVLQSPEMSIESIFNIVKKKMELLVQGNDELEKMATTLIVCKISKNGLEIANVGDSRAYWVEKNSIKKITTDHTQKQALIERGTFSKKELKGHHSGNVLTNSLRSSHDFRLDLFKKPLKTGSVILMSDGAYRAIEETRVIGNNGASDLMRICSNIKQRVLKNGPRDDYSLVAVSYECG